MVVSTPSPVLFYCGDKAEGLTSSRPCGNSLAQRTPVGNIEPKLSVVTLRRAGGARIYDGGTGSLSVGPL